MIDIVEMILAGKVSYLGKLNGLSGIAELLVDCEDVQVLQSTRLATGLTQVSHAWKSPKTAKLGNRATHPA